MARPGNTYRAARRNAKFGRADRRVRPVQRVIDPPAPRRKVPPLQWPMWQTGEHAEIRENGHPQRVVKRGFRP